MNPQLEVSVLRILQNFSYMAANVYSLKIYLFVVCITHTYLSACHEYMHECGICSLLSYGFPTTGLRSPGLVVIIFNHLATLPPTIGVAKDGVSLNYEPFYPIIMLRETMRTLNFCLVNRATRGTCNWCLEES